MDYTRKRQGIQYEQGAEEEFNSEEPHAFRFILSIILQNTTATPVLTAVATIPGPTTAAGFTLPYWLRSSFSNSSIAFRPP